MSRREHFPRLIHFTVQNSQILVCSCLLLLLLKSERIEVSGHGENDFHSVPLRDHEITFGLGIGGWGGKPYRSLLLSG